MLANADESQPSQLIMLLLKSWLALAVTVLTKKRCLTTSTLANII